MMDELSRIRKARQRTDSVIQKMKQDLEEQRQIGERKKQALIELQMRNEELSTQLMDSEGKRDLVSSQVLFHVSFFTTGSTTEECLSCRESSS
jgi:hypothetical protein